MKIRFLCTRKNQFQPKQFLLDILERRRLFLCIQLLLEFVHVALIKLGTFNHQNINAKQVLPYS
jgi:hypothetical protein